MPARVRVAVVFFVNGALFATWAARIPDVAGALGMGPAELALAVSGISVGAVAGLPLSSALVGRLGPAVVVRLVLVPYGVALALIPPVGSVAVLVPVLAAFGMGNGMLDVAMNAGAAEVERRYGRQIMAGFHSLFSWGGLAGAATGAAAAASGVRPAVHLPVAAAVLVAAGLVASRRFPEPGPAGPGPDPDGRPARWTPDRRLVALGLLVFASLVVEGAASDWSAVYVQTGLGGPPGAGALAFAAFSLAMAGSRLVADRIVTAAGPVRFVRSAATTAAAGALLVVLGPWPWTGVLGFGLLGLGLAGLVPTLFSRATRCGGPPATAIATVSTIGYLGFLAGPGVIGGLAAAAGLRWALGVTVLLAVVIVLAAGTVREAADPGR